MGATHALQPLSDALRYELSPFRIKPSLIEPGVTRTEFAETAMSPVTGFEQSVDPPSSRPTCCAIGWKPPQLARRSLRTRSTSRLTQRRPAARYVAPRFGHLLLAMLAITPTWIGCALFRRLSLLSRRELAPPA